MALKAKSYDLVNIYSSTHTKQDFIEACIKEYLITSECWGDYWSLIDATWDCATDTAEEKQDDLTTGNNIPPSATPSGEIKPNCTKCGGHLNCMWKIGSPDCLSNFCPV